MDISTVSTSSKYGVLKGANSPALERSLLLESNKNTVKKSILWTFVNVTLLAVIFYDLSFTCPHTTSYYEYFEYGLITTISINVLFHLTRIFANLFRYEQIPVSLNQNQQTLGTKNSDGFKIGQKNEDNSNLLNSSWYNSSINDSANLSTLSTSWTFKKGSPMRTFSEKIDAITDENSLNEFLKERETFEKINKLQNQSSPQPKNLLSTFWRNPLTNTKDTFVLSKCTYQLSPLLPRNPQSTTEDTTVLPSLEEWTKINVDIVALTQWNENLRKWLSQTILERLVHEIDVVNRCLDNHGLYDMKLGQIGLDRLRKTANNVLVVNLIPTLKMLIPFLEIAHNQEYLIERLRQLAQGGCMSDFKWNSGGTLNGKPWNDTLPTDCKLVMHLLATYLDIQLVPLPSAPDLKPFTGYHFIKFGEKLPKTNGIFINEVSENPPHYRVVIGERVYEMGKGYNNMFHSILFFLYYVNKIEQGMIGRVNLGKAGVNMLWIINQQ